MRLLSYGLGRYSCGFEDGGHALAAANAHGLEPITGTPSTHFIKQGSEHAHAGGADRMSERDAGAVDVQTVVIVPVPAFEYRENLSSECFVEFDEIDLVERETGARKQA